MQTAHQRFPLARSVIALLRTSAANFGADGAATHAAAIAYAAVVSIAPLLVVGIGIAGQALKIAYGGHQHHIVEDRLIGLLATAVGADAGGSVRTIVDRAFASYRGSVLAQLVGWVAFAVAASGFFLTLQTALNAIFHAKPARGFGRTLRDRLASLVMLGLAGALVLATIVCSTLVPSVGSDLGALASFALIALLFALLFKILPDAPIAWRDAGAGAVITALLFTCGEYAVGIYLRRIAMANGYGAAGSLVVLLVWVYYSAMLLLFGAEITHALRARRNEGENSAEPCNE